MARIAIVLANDFEDSEFEVPHRRLKEAGHEVNIVGEKVGERLSGKKGAVTAVTEKEASQVAAGDYDALVVPGGYSPDKLRMVEPMVRLTRAIFEQEKPVAAICHGGSLLVEADVVRGRNVTSWPSIRTDLGNAGAIWKDAEVVKDRNLITSRKPDDLDAFCKVILDELASATRA